MSVEIVIFERSDLDVSATQLAREMIDAAISDSALIGRVSNPADNEQAAAAQKQLSTLVRAIDKARLDATKRFRDATAECNRKAADLAGPLNQELTRISALIGDFHALELARQKAAEKALREELDKIESEKNAAIVTAKNIDEIEQIRADACEKQAIAQAALAPPAPARAARQSIRPDWDPTVTNIHLLYAKYPQCVKLEPRISEIKALLNQGVTPEQLALCGVVANPIMKSYVR